MKERPPRLSQPTLASRRLAARGNPQQLVQRPEGLSAHRLDSTRRLVFSCLVSRTRISDNSVARVCSLRYSFFSIETERPPSSGSRLLTYGSAPLHAQPPRTQLLASELVVRLSRSTCKHLSWEQVLAALQIFELSRKSRCHVGAKHCKSKLSQIDCNTLLLALRATVLFVTF